MGVRYGILSQKNTIQNHLHENIKNWSVFTLKSPNNRKVEMFAGFTICRERHMMLWKTVKGKYKTFHEMNRKQTS